MSATRSMRIAGLLLAAGRSRRMGALKQTLAWRGAGGAMSTTVIASAFDAIAPHVARMFVTVGADAAAVLAALAPRRFISVPANSDAPMYESLRAGLRAIAHDQAHESSQFDAVMLQPGDHPGVALDTITTLLAGSAADHGRAIMPEHRGKGGHPAIIPRSLFEPLISHDGTGGLRQLWIDHPEWRVRLAVHDPLCTVDLDTPEAYQHALGHCETGCE